jgi:PmbA protein
MDELTDIVAQSLAAARHAGAEAADVLLLSGQSLEVAVREGKTEKLERSEAQDLGLRVFIGAAQAIVSASKLDPATIRTTAERAVAMARLAPADPFAGLADAACLASDPIDLDLVDDGPIDEQRLFALAGEAEAAALAVPGVSKSSGAGASTSRRQVVLGTSTGFLRAYQRTGSGFSVSAIAGNGSGMERDYAYSTAVHSGDLKSPAEIGKEAGERAVRRLNPRKVPSQTIPIVYEPRVAASLLGHLAGAISGTAVARGTSFLKDMLNKAVFGHGITIVDDPLMRRGAASRPFDAEGVAVANKELVKDGNLQSWLLDVRSARQLKLQPTGHAARSTGGTPSPSHSNLYLRRGTLPPAALLDDIRQGLFVTELLGMGVNAVTGDYSRGASGLWIENGRLGYPVSEITIAGNLRTMFGTLTCADDLEFKGSVNAPTCRVEGMTVAGL